MIRFRKDVRPYNCFSNFYPCTVAVDGMRFRSAEAAFQAQKVPLEKRRDFIFCTPSAAKRLGRHVPLPADWDDVRDEAMHKVVYAKFSKNENLRQILLSTEDEELVEDTTGWHDNIWGDCSCPKCQYIKGRNKLGKILMQVRTEIKTGEMQNAASMKNPNCFEESTTHGTGICIAVDIKWDTEGKNVELPYFVEIPDDVNDDIDAISDYLHDMTGFCLFGFKLTYKTFIRIDSNVPHTVRGYFRDGAYVVIKPCSSKHHINNSENPTWVQAFWYDSNGNEIGRSAVKDTFFSDWTMNTSIDPELGEPITYTAQVFDI